MAAENLSRDQNRVTVLGAITDDSNAFVTQLRVDPATNRLKVTGTVSISGATLAAHTQTDVFTSTNGQTAFTATQTVATTIYLAVSGVLQTPTTDFTATTTTATLSAGIPAGLPVVWTYFY